MAAIALARLHHYTGDVGYHDKAEQTLETFAGVAEQFGIFAATYGIAIAYLLESPVQVVVVGEDESAANLLAEAVRSFAFNKTALRLARQPGCGGKSSARLGGNYSEPSSARLRKLFRSVMFRISLSAAGERGIGTKDRVAASS